MAKEEKTALIQKDTQNELSPANKKCYIFSNDTDHLIAKIIEGIYTKLEYHEIFPEKQK